jgi:1,4-dihydroxy-2-naphthoyl-CoA hydrolase
MRKWTKSISLEQLNHQTAHTMAEVLEIKFTAIGDDFLKATMPVNHKTKQPYGLLHGGASAALAETIGSVASSLCLQENQICVGMEINCNHLRAKRNGIVTATAKPLHIGATSHVWDIRIEDENNKLICVSRLTVAVLRNKTKEA